MTYFVPGIHIGPILHNCTATTNVYRVTKDSATTVRDFKWMWRYFQFCGNTIKESPICASVQCMIVTRFKVMQGRRRVFDFLLQCRNAGSVYSVTTACPTYDREVVGSTLGRVAIKWLYGWTGDCLRHVNIWAYNQHQGKLSLPSLQCNLGKLSTGLSGWGQGGARSQVSGGC